MSLFDELKRRNVFRVGVAYAIASWVLLQVADLVLEAIEAPSWVLQALMLIVGLGFIVALVIAWAYELTPEGIKKESEVDRSQSITGDTGRKLDRIIISFLAAAVVILLADRFINPQATETPQTSEKTLAVEESESAVQEPGPESMEKSIAVLPFSNMSGDQENEYFADGISEEILNALAQVGELKVAGRTSAFAFKGQNQDLRTIGEALGVNHVLEGSVRKAGNKVRVTAQLIQVSDGFHLWSNTWDRELDDIFAIQDEIAGAILAELQAELVGSQEITSERVDPVAYEQYLRARQLIYNRTQADLEFANNLLQGVTQKAPGFAAAWAQLGIATILLSDDSYGTIPAQTARTAAKSYLDKALELEPDSAEAEAGLGLYYNNLPGGASVVAQAVTHLERALELNPSFIDASNWLQQAYIRIGRSQDAQRITEDMFERDPFYKPGVGNLIGSYLSYGQTDKARQVLDRIRPYIRDENFLARFESYLFTLEGSLGKAYMLAQFGAEREPDNPTAQSALQFAMLGLGMDLELLEQDAEIPVIRLISLVRLGRLEEGLRFAQETSDQQGFPGPLIQYYHVSSQPQRLVDYFDARWPELARFEEEYPAQAGFGYSSMYQLAFAYRKAGRPEKYEQALALARKAHDRDLEAGFETRFLQRVEAEYWAVAGDFDRSIDHLEQALEMGESFPLSDLALLPEFDDMRDNARFRALAERAHAAFNEQRVIAGLDPVEAEWPPLGG